jgi:ribonuclease BN (tRNA processing enzyme)
VTLTVTVLGCSGTYAGPGEACSGYLVRSAGANVVLDLGPGTLAVLQEHTDLAALDAVVLSHEHPDHWLELPVLRNALRYVLHREGLTVYAPAGTWRLADTLVGEIAPTFAPVTTMAGQRVTIGDQHLSFDRTDHPVETLAVRVDAEGRSLLYTADTGPAWDPSGLAGTPAAGGVGGTGASGGAGASGGLPGAGPAGGVDLVIAEASLSGEEEAPVHLTAAQAGALARRAGAGRLVVTHVVPGVDRDAQRAAAGAVFGGPVEVARSHVTFTV